MVRDSGKAMLAQPGFCFGSLPAELHAKFGECVVMPPAGVFGKEQWWGVVSGGPVVGLTAFSCRGKATR